jgi:hypothetical protein
LLLLRRREEEVEERVEQCLGLLCLRRRRVRVAVRGGRRERRGL